MYNPLEQMMYGKRESNLNIKVVGLKTLWVITRKKIKEELENYKGDFMVTARGYLIKGHNEDLETKFADLNLTESENVEALLKSDESKFKNIMGNGTYKVHIHYCVDNPPVIIGTDYIIKNWKGLRIERYTPVLQRPCPMERETRFCFA